MNEFDFLVFCALKSLKFIKGILPQLVTMREARAVLRFTLYSILAITAALAAGEGE